VNYVERIRFVTTSQSITWLRQEHEHYVHRNRKFALRFRSASFASDERRDNFSHGFERPDFVTKRSSYCSNLSDQRRRAKAKKDVEELGTEHVTYREFGMAACFAAITLGTS